MLIPNLNGGSEQVDIPNLPQPGSTSSRVLEAKFGAFRSALALLLLFVGLDGNAMDKPYIIHSLDQ